MVRKRGARRLGWGPGGDRGCRFGVSGRTSPRGGRAAGAERSLSTNGSGHFVLRAVHVVGKRDFDVRRTNGTKIL
eukprot:gene7414-biopygen7555